MPYFCLISFFTLEVIDNLQIKKEKKEKKTSKIPYKNENIIGFVYPA